MEPRVMLVGLMLVLGAVAALPSASAASMCQIFKDPPQACYTAEAIAFGVADYALCYYHTAPDHWGDCV